MFDQNTYMLPLAIDNYAGHGVRSVPPADGATAQIFCTYPASFMTKGSQFVSEFIASTLLIFVIFALKDETNNGAALGAKNWFPLALFFLIFGIGACFGWVSSESHSIAHISLVSVDDRLGNWLCHQSCA